MIAEYISFFIRNWEKIVKDATPWVSGIWALSSALISFIDFFSDIKLYCFWLSVAISILTIILCGIFAQKKKQLTFRRNGTSITIKFGDIFEENGNKVIAFNEFFDTQVDDVIITKNSLNGRVATKYLDVNSFNKGLNEDSHCKSMVREVNCTRRNGGNTTRYNLGTCFRHNDIIAVAFTRFDKDDHAYLSLSDYYACLCQMWNEISLVYNGENIVFPLLSTGITRKNANITDQESLQILLDTLKYSDVKFSDDIRIQFVLANNRMNNIFLYELNI